MAKTESKGEWTSRTLAEWKQSPHVVWRAQISKAPDGKEFAGVRKYIVKSDGSEIADRSGITFAYDGGSLSENVDALIDLFTKLKGGAVKLGKKHVVNGVKVKSKAKAETESLVFVLRNASGKFFRRRVKTEDGIEIKTTTDPAKAKPFASAAEAKVYGEEKRVFMYKAGWKVAQLDK